MELLNSSGGSEAASAKPLRGWQPTWKQRLHRPRLASFEHRVSQGLLRVQRTLTSTPEPTLHGPSGSAPVQRWDDFAVPLQALLGVEPGPELERDDQGAGPDRRDVIGRPAVTRPRPVHAVSTQPPSLPQPPADTLAVVDHPQPSREVAVSLPVGAGARAVELEVAIASPRVHARLREQAAGDTGKQIRQCPRRVHGGWYRRHPPTLPVSHRWARRSGGPPSDGPNGEKLAGSVDDADTSHRGRVVDTGGSASLYRPRPVRGVGRVRAAKRWRPPVQRRAPRLRLAGSRLLPAMVVDDRRRRACPQAAVEATVAASRQRGPAEDVSQPAAR